MGEAHEGNSEGSAIGSNLIRKRECRDTVFRRSWNYSGFSYPASFALSF